MTFAYYGGQHDVDSLKVMHERGEKVTRNLLKKLEGIMYPEYYKKIALAMQESRTTVRSLHNQMDTIITQQWVMMHLDHPNNGDWVLLEKVCVDAFVHSTKTRDSKRNGADCAYPLSQGFQQSCLNVGIHP